MKRIKLNKLLNNKYLSYYEAIYEIPEKYNYYFVSRRPNELVCDTKTIDAVQVFTYSLKTREVFFIKEFRYPINSFVYETPAGLIDAGETPEQAAIREVQEEIGASVISLKLVAKSGPTSSGITDETIQIYFADVNLDSVQNLEHEEEIEIVKVKFEDVENFIDTVPMGVKATLLARLFLAYNN